MFPTIGHLFFYLTGLQLRLPVPTFGFFMMLSFAGAWLTFLSEYKRKEAAGIIHPFPDPPTDLPPLLYTLCLFPGAFLIGFKIVYWWTNRSYYIGTLPDFLLSLKGNLYGGLTTGFVTMLLACLYHRRHTKQDPKTSIANNAPHQQSDRLTHPYQLMDRLLLFCGLSGFAGAILFAKIEGINGLNYYGALLAGALTYFYINRKHGIPLIIAADIGSPGMMLAYGIGRIGCHLAGDGDWGIVNESPQPAWLQWAPASTWRFTYPHNSIHKGIYIPGCTDNYCTQLPIPVYPTSFYEAVACLLLFAALWSLRRRIKPPGFVFAMYALLNGAERFTIEFIRINPRYPIAGFNLTQAQIIALAWMLTGVITLFHTLRHRTL